MKKNPKHLLLSFLLIFTLSAYQANSMNKQPIEILSDQLFFSIGPDEDVLDKALADNFPEWATFEQTFSSGGVSVNESAGRVVRTASFQEQFALNSAVNLITIGVNSGWQLPADGDLYSDALSTGEKPENFMAC